MESAGYPVNEKRFSSTGKVQAMRKHFLLSLQFREALTCSLKTQQGKACLEIETEHQDIEQL